MKEIIKRLLIAMVSLLLSVEVFAYAFKVDGIYYGFVSNNPNGVYVTYKDTNYNSYMGDVKIPPTVEYNDTIYTVTVIGPKAFYDCEYMTSIDIPHTIKRISSNAFNTLNHLDRVNITDLSAYCQIKFESYPLKDGAGLYLNGEIVDTIKGLDETCTKISAGAFYGYKHLLSAIIPESVTTLEEDVFYKCSKLKYFEAGSNVTTIGESVFYGCSSLSKIKFVDGEETLTLGRWDFNYSGGAFKDCPLEEVYIGRNINFEYVGYNSDSFLPFPNRIAKAIFNKYAGGTEGYHYMYGFASIGEAYFTPDCEKIVFPYESKKSPGTIYIFSNKITKIQNSEMGSTGTYRSFDKIYVIDKENLPEAFSSVKGDYYNLVDLTNVENGFTCEYGSTELPLHNIEFTNNVESMDVNIKMDSINLNAGFHNEGLPISFTNDLWNCVINYPLEYTITKAPLTIIANDVQRKYGEENPELTCSYFGFKNNENEDVLTQKPQITTNATRASNVGTYSIIPVNAEAKNYTMVYERGSLTITQADQAIKWDDGVYYAEVGEQIELTAISTSGLEIKYEVSDESLAEIYRSGGKQFIDCLKSGEVTIKAYQDGNENFKPADRLTKKLIIKDKVVQAENISLSESSISLRMGESYKLTATIYPENATSKEVVWKSSNENIVAISNTGVITALEEGATTIVATTVDGTNLSAVCDVVVQPTLAESLILDKSEVTLNVNEEIILVATITPTSIPNNELRWTSSNDAIATVDKDGIVTAIATGEAIITVATTDGSNLSATCKVTVVSSLAQSITLDKTEVSLKATETATLVATILPELTTDKSVTWTSSNEAVATVDANGVVTAIALGEAVITATTTDGTNLSATCKVTVVPTLAETITLDKTEISLEATETATLVATVLPENATDKSVTWKSSNEAVAIVDKDGVVTAIAVGEAIITATTGDGSNISTNCKVIVEPTLATSITLDYSESEIVEKSDLQLVATILPELATNKGVMWSSSDMWVASVDANGLVRAYSVGEAVITATTVDGSNLSASCKVTVVSSLAQSITLDKTEVSLKATETATLVATVLPETTSNKSVEWKSSNDAVATVNNNGEVTAIAVGEAIITATTTDETNLSASCKVAVVPTLAETITLDKTEISLEATETATLVATVLPELATDKSVEWSSSNESVAAVYANGVVTAIAVGEATITATTADGSGVTATCNVTVIPTLAVSIEVMPNTVEAEENSEVQLSVNILPENATYKSVEWSSSNDAIASVNANGLVKIRKEGNVVITATTTDGTNLSATCSINVYSGIDGVNGNDVIVATIGDNIVVKNAKLGSVVNVYASNGALIASEEATDGSVVVEAPVNGVYVVKVGKQTVKVII